MKLNRKTKLSRNSLFFLAIVFFSISLTKCNTHKPSFEGTAFVKHHSLENTGFTQSKLDSLNNFLKKQP